MDETYEHRLKIILLIGASIRSPSLRRAGPATLELCSPRLHRLACSTHVDGHRGFGRVPGAGPVQPLYSHRALARGRKGAHRSRSRWAKAPASHPPGSETVVNSGTRWDTVGSRRLLSHSERCEARRGGKGQGRVSKLRDPGGVDDQRSRRATSRGNEEALSNLRDGLGARGWG